MSGAILSPTTRCRLLLQRMSIQPSPTIRQLPQRIPPPGPIQFRSASILGSLSDVRAAYGHNIRRGRGPSSGKGKTSGRGHKGQKQHGKVPFGFNGGQTPDEVVSGSRGFKNRYSVNMKALNLDTLQSWIDQGRLPLDRTITVRDLVKSRAVHNTKDGVKLLSRVRTAMPSLYKPSADHTAG